VAAQTLGRSEVDQAAKAALQDRILALSRAHDVLTSHAWEKVGLREIASQATAPYQAGGQISVAGPDVSLSPSQALALALALAMPFHELATNAAKYGALSVLAGRVSIAWALEAEHLRVSWVERSGPPVIFPSRRGFGRRLLEQGLVRELRADVRLSFQAAGLSCEISAPMAVRELAAGRASPRYSPRS
jgi:two-component sensor histidine kinase